MTCVGAKRDSCEGSGEEEEALEGAVAAAEAGDSSDEERSSDPETAPFLNPEAGPFFDSEAGSSDPEAGPSVHAPMAPMAWASGVGEAEAVEGAEEEAGWVTGGAVEEAAAEAEQEEGGVAWVVPRLEVLSCMAKGRSAGRCAEEEEEEASERPHACIDRGLRR